MDGESFFAVIWDRTEILINYPENLRSAVSQNLGTISSSCHVSMHFDQSMSFAITGHWSIHPSFIWATWTNLCPFLIEMLIFSHLIICNFSFHRSLLHCSQTVQNTPASILTQSNSWSYITLIFISLHWLPVHFRIDFNILVLTYRTLHGQAPQYICDLPHPQTMSHALRSSFRGSWVFFGHISRFRELVQLLIFGIVSQLVWELWMLRLVVRKIRDTSQNFEESDFK